MSRKRVFGVTFDAGALLAFDHPAKANDAHALLDRVRLRGGDICIPAGALAQAWRGPRQVRLARLLKAPDVEIASLGPAAARGIGELCARTGHHDVVDVHVALCARERGHAVVTSDPDDLRLVDPGLSLIVT